MKKLRYRLLISVNGKWVILSNTWNIPKINDPFHAMLKLINFGILLSIVKIL